jgi:hypothetical protein
VIFIFVNINKSKYQPTKTTTHSQLHPTLALPSLTPATKTMQLSPHVVTAVVLHSIKTMFDNDAHAATRAGSSNIPRERVPVETISRLGPHMFRKCYRMTETMFWKLHGKIRIFMKSHTNKRKRGATPNGDISSSSRLSMALRWFAGGDPLDIFQVHGVGYEQVYNSVCEVVDAINQCPEIQIRFPTDHRAQLLIAEGFQKKSRVGFSTCVGCIDGMLIWINKPNQWLRRVSVSGWPWVPLPRLYRSLFLPQKKHNNNAAKAMNNTTTTHQKRFPNQNLQPV